jgi:hypothetical protein
MKTLLTPDRPEGVAVGTRLGRIIFRLDRVGVVYHLPVPSDNERFLDGRGTLHVDIEDHQVRCHVVGEVFRPSPFEFAFHSFWLTRRGMIMIVACLLAEKSSTSHFISTTGQPDRDLKAEAARWFQAKALGNRWKSSH